MSVLVVGSVAIDDVKTPFGRGAGVLGGSASYFSLAAAQFARVRVVADAEVAAAEAGHRIASGGRFLLHPGLSIGRVASTVQPAGCGGPGAGRRARGRVAWTPHA